MKQPSPKNQQTARKVNCKDCLEGEQLSVKLNQWWAQFLFSFYQHGGMENQTQGKYFWSSCSDLWPSQPLWQDQRSVGFFPVEHHQRPNYSYLGKNKTSLCFSENSVWHQAQRKLLVSAGLLKRSWDGKVIPGCCGWLQIMLFPPDFILDISRYRIGWCRGIHYKLQKAPLKVKVIWFSACTDGYWLTWEWSDGTSRLAGAWGLSALKNTDSQSGSLSEGLWAMVY